MLWQFVAILCGGGLVGVALWLASKMRRNRNVQKGLRIMFMLCLLMTLGAGCTTWQTSNASACLVPFDYGDDGVNDQNARALLIHYCICRDEKACK